jgi:hypothetical protein
LLPAVYQRDFISTLAETGNVSETCRRLGISRMTPYEWRMSDEAFAQQWDAALEVNRDALRHRVVETACAMGLARMVPLCDPDTGDAVLDDDFEPVMVPDTSHVDARVLMKLMDKVLRDEAKRVDQRSLVSAELTHRYDGPTQVVLVGPDGEVVDAG